jgi:hypothetical protein
MMEGSWVVEACGRTDDAHDDWRPWPDSAMKASRTRAVCEHEAETACAAHPALRFRLRNVISGEIVDVLPRGAGPR